MLFSTALDRLALAISGVLLATAVLVIATRCEPRRAIHVRHPAGLHQVARCSPHPDAHLVRRAHRQYLRGDFAGAATTVRAAHLPGNLAERFDRLAVAYEIAMDPRELVIDGFEAAMTARRLDLQLTGAWRTKIEARLVAVASRASVAFMAKQRYDDAHRAVDAAETYGGHTPTTQAVRAALSYRGR